MAKPDPRPKGRLRLTIEFADNGIILRDPDCEDNVWLAVNNGNDRDGHDLDCNNEKLTIGRQLYNWLTEVLIYDHSATWIATGAELDITATLTGRKRI